MGFRNIKIDSHLELSIKENQLVISSNEDITIPLEDINCIMIENQSVTLSSYLLQKVAEEGIALYVCDKKHIPNAVAIPLNCHSRHFKLLKAQITINKPLQNRIWQQIVIQKIINQGICLELNGIDGFKELYSMAREVQSYDRTHVEAKAAAFYFKKLFGSYFAREEDHIINSALNYGYAIVRGIVARTIVCYGFEPAIGLFHKSELNSFNLADDLMEPYRPLVDFYVSGLFDYSEANNALTPEIKKGLFNIINYDMKMQKDQRIVSNCIDIMVASLSGCLQNTKKELLLPELIALQVHSYE